MSVCLSCRLLVDIESKGVHQHPKFTIEALVVFSEVEDPLRHRSRMIRQNQTLLRLRWRLWLHEKERTSAYKLKAGRFTDDGKST